MCRERAGRWRWLACVVGAALAAARCLAQSPADLHSWLERADAARNAFPAALIRARASQIENGNVQGTAEFDIYVKGRDRALIVFRGGKNDGRKALTVGDRMWLIVPGAENPVPITQNQRLMGGASFGDVARMRLAEDFTATARPGTEKIGDRETVVLDLTAVSPKAPFPKVTLWVDAAPDRLPRQLLFYLPSGKAARQVRFTKFTRIGGKEVVSEMEVRDLLGPGANTVTRLEYTDIKPANIDDRIFTPDGAKAM